MVSSRWWLENEVGIDKTGDPPPDEINSLASKGVFFSEIICLKQQEIAYGELILRFSLMVNLMLNTITTSLTIMKRVMRQSPGKKLINLLVRLTKNNRHIL